MDNDEEWENRRRVAALSVMAASLTIIRIFQEERRRIPRNISIDRELDRTRYIHSIIQTSDEECINMTRMSRSCFHHLCDLLRTRGLLRDTFNVTVEEQLCMFLHTIGHSVRNRVIRHNFFRSSETVSRYFTIVLRAIGYLKDEYIRPPSSVVPNEIRSNNKFWPWFKDYIGAVDGTNIYASVPKDMRPRFRGRKDYPTQNVMAVVNFDISFTYVLAGWEGSAHDLIVLNDALERENGLKIFEGKYLLADGGYTTKPSFIAPYRNVRYHLTNFKDDNPPRNAKELFNYRHSSLQTTVERAFGALKNRFALLDCKKNKFLYSVQVDLVIVCCILHNLILRFDPNDQIFTETIVDTQDTLNASRYRQLTRAERNQSSKEWCNLRDEIATQMWNGR